MPLTNRRIASTVAVAALMAAGLVAGAGTASAQGSSGEPADIFLECGKTLLPGDTWSCNIFGQTFDIPEWLS